MTFNQSQFKAQFRASMVAIFAISLYFTGYINCFLDSSRFPTRDFKTVLKAFFTCKPSILFFPIIFVVLTGILAYAVHKSWEDKKYEDKFGRNFRHSKEADPYGDAHALAPHEYKDIAQIRTLDRCKGPILGQLTQDGEECIDFTDYSGRYYNKNIIAIALPGGGKSFSFVQPMIYQDVKARHSIVVTDSKGALYEDVSEYLRDQGYIVRKLDLTNLRKSDGWDCMKILKGEDQGTYVKIFANTIVSNISNEENIYSSGSNSLLTALILRVLLGHEYSEDQKNIRSVYDLLQNPAGYAFLEQKFDKNLLQDDELPCLGPYLAYKQASPNLAANIAIHLANGLGLFQDPEICEILSRDDMDMTLPGRVPCAYFIQFPDNHDTYRFLISLFFSMFFLTLMDYADHHTAKRRLDIPVDFIMDEFFSIGVIPEWAAKMSTIRSRGITATMILQDIAQLQTRYEASWKTIINDTATMVTLGINDSVETAPFLSKRIGVATIEVKSSSETDFAGETKGELFKKKSVGAGKRELLTPDEIMKLDKDECLILFAGKNVIKANKTPHTMFPDSEYLTPIRPDENVPGTDMPGMLDFSDRKGKDELIEMETAYRKQFWAEDKLTPIGRDGATEKDRTRPSIPDNVAITKWEGTHTMHPDLRIKDLSDAMYTTEPTSPVKVAFGIVVYDIKNLIRWFKEKRRKKGNEKEASVLDEEEQNQNNDYISNYHLADKGSFRRFCMEYRKKKEESAENVSSDEDDEEFDLIIPTPKTTEAKETPDKNEVKKSVCTSEDGGGEDHASGTTAKSADGAGDVKPKKKASDHDEKDEETRADQEKKGSQDENREAQQKSGPSKQKRPDKPKSTIPPIKPDGKIIYSNYSPPPKKKKVDTPADDSDD